MPEAPGAAARRNGDRLCTGRHTGRLRGWGWGGGVARAGGAARAGGLQSAPGGAGCARARGPLGIRAHPGGTAARWGNAVWGRRGGAAAAAAAAAAATAGGREPTARGARSLEACAPRARAPHPVVFRALCALDSSPRCCAPAPLGEVAAGARRRRRGCPSKCRPPPRAHAPRAVLLCCRRPRPRAARGPTKKTPPASPPAERPRRRRRTSEPPP
jgi:hypothetical protein